MRYRSYSEDLKQRYGMRVYKIPVHLPVTCPNRDGNRGHGGCIFCGEAGAGLECNASGIDLDHQISENLALIRRKYKPEGFVAYFQNFSNTYQDVDTLLKALDRVYGAFQQEAAQLVEVALSTRPDCVRSRDVDRLQEWAEAHRLVLSFELGLQTVNWRTLSVLNRGHGLAEFVDAALCLRKRQIPVCVHMILDLPWDTGEDVAEAARLLTVLDITHIKVHSLFVLKDTVLGDMYEAGAFEPLPVSVFIQRVVRFIRLVKPNMVFHRLVGRAPVEHALYCNGGMSWWRIKEAIEAELEALDAHQGDQCTYLDGPALQRFPDT